MSALVHGKKRALILAGGGIKVSFQAGVLQVWLDEAGLTFDHVDAASGGVFNLAMMCQGMSGLASANHWRPLNPRAGLSCNAAEFPKLLYAESLVTLDRYRQHVFTAWGLDWEKIRASALQGTFNVCNFSRKELHIEVKELKADVALHYLIDFSQDRLIEAVNLRVQRARQWCEEQGISLKPYAGEYPTEVHTDPTQLSFTEEMKGFITFGEIDYDKSYRQGKQDGTSLMFHLTITIDGVNHFVTHPEHETHDLEGYVRCDALGGELTVEQGTFNLFVDDADPARKTMLYRLFFRDSGGQPLTLSGFKDIQDDPARTSGTTPRRCSHA